MLSSYGNVHQFITRTLASCGVMTVPEIRTAIHRYSGVELQESILDVVEFMNESELIHLKLKIKHTTDRQTNEEVLVFMSLGDDVTTRAQNLFSGNDLEFFKLVTETIISKDVRQLSHNSAMNIVIGMTTYQKTNAEKLLKTLCRMRYLELENNYYALGVRGIHEFATYFVHNMPDSIKKCHVCKDMVFRGYNCPACGKAIHTGCLNRFVEKEQKWPCCMTTYSGDQIKKMIADSELAEDELAEEEPPPKKKKEATAPKKKEAPPPKKQKEAPPPKKQK